MLGPHTTIALLVTASLAVVTAVAWQCLQQRRKDKYSEFAPGIFAALKAMMDTPYSEDTHGSLLVTVKEKFFGAVEAPDWRTIGFQRRDSPVSDFRAFGVLTLNVMDRFDMATYERMANLLREHETLAYPFALTVITIGRDLALAIGSDSPQLRSYLKVVSAITHTPIAKTVTQLQNCQHDSVLRVYTDLLEALMISFTEAWITAQPRTLLEFNEVYRKYKAQNGLK